jgi:hypothetical protein
LFIPSRIIFKQITIMSPTYTMSAHLCKQIYSSWRQARQTSPDLNSPSTPTVFTNNTNNNPTLAYPHRPSSPAEKRSMDSDRSESSPPPLTRKPSGSNWQWGSR